MFACTIFNTTEVKLALIYWMMMMMKCHLFNNKVLFRKQNNDWIIRKRMNCCKLSIYYDNQRSLWHAHTCTHTHTQTHRHTHIYIHRGYIMFSKKACMHKLVLEYFDQIYHCWKKKNQRLGNRKSTYFFSNTNFSITSYSLN